MKQTIKNSDGFALPALDGRKYLVHVISGTHWDREWRFTAEQSKFRLVELIDGVLDILEKNPEYKHFVLDGGSVILEDYIAMRPENRERLTKLIQGKRISVVSWYTLLESNLVAPEAMIRNLLIGRRVAKEFGGPMREGYTATSYGQPAQLPQIYQNFGIRSAIFYRGTNKHVIPPVCWWKGRDGSQVLLIRCFDEWNRSNWTYYACLPIIFGKTEEPVPLSLLQYHFDSRSLPVHMADEELYEMGFKSLKEEAALPKEKKILLERYQMFRDQAYKYAIGRHVLGLDMEDNGSPKTHTPELIESLNRNLTDTEVIQSTMDEYVDAVFEEIEGIELHTAKGEMRYTAVEFGMNGLFGMTSSSRVKIKLLNERAETALIMVAEPLAGIAEKLGFEYPRIHLDQAWLMLLKNHSHDSICGAASDDVHEDMIYRFRQARTVAEEVSKRALEAIWRHIGYPDYKENDQGLTVFNTLPFRRNGVRMFVLDLPVEQFKTPHHRRHLGCSTDYDLFDIFDGDGNKVPYDIIDVQDISIHCESKIESSGASIQARRHRILMSVELPPLGYRSFIIRRRQPRYVFNPQPGTERGHISQPGGIMENEFLKVTINANGTFNLTDKKNKQTFENLHYFDDRVSAGHSHLDSNTIRDAAVTSLGLQAIITMMESNPHRGCYRIDLKMPIPKEAIGYWYRSNNSVDIPVTVWLTLCKGSKRLEIRTRINNPACDHRLLVMLPTQIKTDIIAVEAPFTVEQRPFLWKDTGDNAEPHYAYQPMQNFIDMTDGISGLAVINRGIREYAVWDDKNRTVSLTLLRTYRPYINANTNMTPEECEKHQGSHSPGEMEFHYALYPHAGDWRKGEVLAEAYDYKAPLRAIQGPAKTGNLPPEHSFFEIEPEGKIMLSALCQSQDGQGTIMRLWNTTDESLDMKIKTTLPFKSVCKVNMAEDDKGDVLTMRRGTITIPIEGAKIVTLRFE